MKKLFYSVVITMSGCWPFIFGMHQNIEQKVTYAQPKTPSMQNGDDASLIGAMANIHIGEPRGKRAVEEKKEEASDDVEAMLTPVNQSRPSFVVNAPVYVSADEESDETDTEIDETTKFAQEDFNNPPFFIHPEKRGSVAILIEPSQVQINASSSLINSLCNKLEQQGFRNPNAQQQASDYVVANFGLNRPRSLSTRKNNLLIKECNNKVTTLIQCRVFGMLWDLPWMRRMANGSLKPSSYAEVKSFYQQLKKKDLQKARKFRRDLENNRALALRRLVPYRALRENVKNHAMTRGLVQLSRDKHPGSHIYLFFCDADTINFNGCFTTYTRLAQEHAIEPITAMTSGYMFANNGEQDPMIMLANELDMCVRDATARIVPRGVYYPEPSLCILVANGKDTVEEHFEKGGECDYTSPQESPIILEQVARRASTAFVFRFEDSLVTAIPHRATTYKTKTKSGASKALAFNAKVDSSINKFQDWSMHDLANITVNMAQSHASSRSWATNVLNAFEVEGEIDVIFMFPPDKPGKTIGIEDTLFIKINNKKTIRDMAISLLSRLFNSYDPKTLAGDGAILRMLLSDHARYQAMIKDVIPANNSARQECADAAWEIVDAPMSRSFFKSLLSVLLKNCDAKLVDAAAKNAGQAIWNTLSQRLAH